MTYHKALDCFKDGLRYIDPKQDPATFDILTGLYQLTEQLAIDHANLRLQVSDLSQQVDALHRR